MKFSYKSLRYFIILICLFQSPFRGLGQTKNDSDTHPTRFDERFILSGFLDARDVVVAPFHWKGSQWLIFGAIATADVALIFTNADKSVMTFAQTNRNNTSNYLEKYVGDPFGSGVFPAVIIGTSYLAGCIFKKDHPKHMAMLTTKSIVISGVTTLLLKSVFERYRPYQDPNPKHWLGPKGQFQFDSYPGGHTTLAFATATMIAQEYPHPLIIPITAYTLATITGLGRINGNYHWASDILMGSAIGYFTSRLIFRHDNWKKCRLKRLKHEPNNDSM